VSRSVLSISSSMIVSVLLSFAWLLSSQAAVAQESYQFALSAGGSKTKLETSGEGVSTSIGATAYLKPVILNGDTPYAEAGFWSRTSSLSALVWQAKEYKLNQIRGGNVLKRWDDERGYLSLNFADGSLPFWLNFSAVYDKGTELEFAGAGQVTSEDRIDYQYILGFYLSRYLSVDLRYNDCDCDVQRYRFYMDWLLQIGGNQFIGIDWSYERTEDKKAGLSVVGGVIRNLDVFSDDRNEWMLKFSYYPSPALGVMATHRVQHYSRLDAEKKFTEIGASYFFTPRFKVSATYYLYKPDFSRAPFTPGSNSYSLTTTLRF
jgi:hypothetical protein